MGIIIKMILKRFWKEIVLLLLLLSVIGGSYWYISNLHSQNKEWQDKYIECNNNNTLLTANNLTLSDAITKQNKEIDDLHKILKTKGKIISKYKEEFEKMKQAQHQQLQFIINEPTPKDCDQSIDYLINGVKDLQWKE